MSRNRNLIGNEAIFVSQTGNIIQPAAPITGLQIHRGQSFSRSFDINRQDVLQAGNIGAIDKIITEAPTVQCSFDWLSTNALNENRIGLVTDFTASAISGILNTGVSSQRNIYLLKTLEGNDAVGNDGTAANNQVEAIGNGFLNSITWRGEVGGFGTCSTSWEGFNWRTYLSSLAQPNVTVDTTNGQDAGGTFSLPAAVSGLANQPSAIAKGDISLQISGTLGVSVADLKLTSYEVTIPLARTVQNAFGTKFGRTRFIQTPITPTMTVGCEMGDLVTGSLSALLCADAGINCRVTLRGPSCANNGDPVLHVELRNAKLKGQSLSTDLNGNETLQISWESSQGNSTANDRGVFLSGLLSH